MASPYVWDQATSTWITASAAGVAVSPLTTKGDVWGYSTTDARIPVGADGDVLTADSTQTLGVKWAAGGGGGGVTSLDSITGAVTLVAGSNVTITDNSPSAGDITIAASGGGGGGGYTIVDYAAFTSATTVTATTIGAAQTIVSGAGFTADGTSHYLVEFYSPTSRPGTTSGDLLRLNLFDGATDLGIISQLASPGGYVAQTILTGYRDLPSAASHTYTVKAWIASSATSGVVNANVGGSSTLPVNGYIMVTKLA